MKVERRTVLPVLAGAGLAQAQDHVHTPEPPQRKAPVYFAETQYNLLAELCDRIVPGARERE